MTQRPDWGHAKRDLVDKLEVLHAAGVPAYWVIDHEARILNLYSYTPQGYLARMVAADAVIRARPFDAVELRVACLFGDEDDEE